MRNTPRQWMALVTSAFLGLTPVVMAAEPVAVRGLWSPYSPAQAASDQAAKGLLARNWGSTTSESADSDVAPEASTAGSAPRAASGALFANWTTTDVFNTTNSNGGSSPISDSDSYQSQSCTNCDCCAPLWCHRCGVFADLLYLRPGNIDYVYAVEQTGTLPTDSPTGPTGRVGFDAAPGYRVGATWALSDCSSIQASYTWFQDDTQSSITANAPNVLIFQPGVPQIPNVGSSAITSSARYDIRFQQLDIDYRGLLYGTQNSYLNYFGGVRYANLKQDFSAMEDTGAPVGLRTATTHISFDGFGIGMGLDGMRRSANCGLLVYGRGSASFVSGQFTAQYREIAQFGPNSVIGNNLVYYRVMTILQTELGTGWQSCDGRLRVTIGYQFAGWFNALTVPSYILGVQNREFHNLNETLTFDGLVTRVLWQF